MSSSSALEWVLSSRVSSSAAKNVLFALVLLARPALQVCASAATLVAVTQLNEKTVRAALQSLELDGLVTRLPVRKGIGGIPVFELNVGNGTPPEVGGEVFPKTDERREVYPIPAVASIGLPDCRSKALQLGARRYRTGRVCLRGHDADRQTVSGACIACARRFTQVDRGRMRNILSRGAR